MPGLCSARHSERRSLKLIEAIWDLRDSAYDEPQLWTGLTAETLFQALAEILEAGGPANSAALSSGELARAIDRARSSRR